MLRLKKIILSILCFVFLFPHFPIGVFAQELNGNKEGLVIENEERKELNNETYEANLIEKEVDIWEIDEDNNLKSFREKILIDGVVEIRQEVLIDDELYVLVYKDSIEIGWILAVNLEPNTYDILEDIHKSDEDEKSEIEEVTSEELDILEEELDEENTSNETDKEQLTNDEVITDSKVEEELSEIEENTNLDSSSSLEALSVAKDTYEVNSVLSTEKIAYSAIVKKAWSINSRPWGTEGSELLMTAEKYVGKTVEVTQEKRTSRSVYALIKSGDKELGWFDTKGLEPFTILSSKEVNYDVTITKNWSVNTQPLGIRGYAPIGASNIVGNEYTVTQEALTQRSTYVLLTQDGKNVGWIDKNGTEAINVVLTTEDVTYAAEVMKAWSINTQPWGTRDSELIMNARDFVGKSIEVVQEKTTLRSTYALIKSGDRELGWFDVDGLKPYAITKSEQVNYEATVIKDWSVNTQPWGIRGSERALEKSILGKKYSVTQEATTPRSTYVLLSKNGTTIGWIDKNGVEADNIVLSTKDVSYSAEIIKPWSINTQPWGTKDSKLIMSAKTYLNNSVEVVQEKVTLRSTYALIKLGNRELGWFDVDGLKLHSIETSRTVNYDVKVTKNWSVNTQPWGVKGFKRITTGNIVGQEYKVTREAVTPRSTFVLLTKNGNTIGWMDKDGIQKLAVVLSTKTVNYTATVEKSWSINTQPYGTFNAKFISTAAKYLGKKVTVVQEKKTARNTYALIQLNGNNIGWIDSNALNTRKIIMIDPGHGGSDPGASAVLNGRRIKEKDLNLSVSLKLRALLEKQGYTVLMTRQTDVTVASLDRARMTNSSNADIFLSIHHNALPISMPNYSTVHGIETFYYKYNKNYPSVVIPDSHNNPHKLAGGFNLAHDIQEGLLAETNARHRRVDDAAFIVIKEVKIPAALTELGFMTNHNELSKLVTDSYQNALARGLAKGINNYYK